MGTGDLFLGGVCLSFFGGSEMTGGGASVEMREVC